MPERVTVATFTDLDEAQIARGYLASGGIEASLESEGMSGVLGARYAVSKAGHSLVVNSADEADAREALAAFGVDETTAAQARAERRCARCGSRNLKTSGMTVLAEILSGVLGALAPAPRTRKVRRTTCGHEGRPAV